jgi:hypothetical protein
MMIRKYFVWSLLMMMIGCHADPLDKYIKSLGVEQEKAARWIEDQLVKKNQTKESQSHCG